MSDITLQTGRFWHDFYGDLLLKRGIPFMQEVDLQPWLPTGWGGRADWLFYNPEYQAFALGDLKTKKGEGMRYTIDGGVSPEYLWQLSAYWYACRNMGLPLVEGFAVLYLPKNDTPDKYEHIEPMLFECKLIPEDQILPEMERRRVRVNEYQQYMNDDLMTVDQRKSVSSIGEEYRYSLAEIYLNDVLEPEMPREQKYWWQKKTQTFDVKLVPHWTSRYCPYPDEICACNRQGTTKIGEYRLDGLYKPRKGYEDIEPLVRPTEREFFKRIREKNE
jgi:hypothetical protein